MATVAQPNARVNSEFIQPIAPGEFAAYLIGIGEHEEAAALQQRQVREGQHAALAGLPYCAAWPVATRCGYVEALQDLEF